MTLWRAWLTALHDNGQITRLAFVFLLLCYHEQELHPRVWRSLRRVVRSLPQHRIKMRRTFSLLPLLSFLFLIAPAMHSAEVDPRTIVYWDEYLAAARTQMQQRSSGAARFLWVDEDPVRVQRVRRGDIVVSPLPDHSPVAVPHGLIHHWIGVAFIPGATIPDLTALVNNYDRYDKIFRPTLIKAELLGSSENDQKLSIVWLQRVLFLTVAFYGEVDFKEVALNDRQGFLDIFASRLQQIEHYGQHDERRLSPDESSAYVWRLVTFARFEERDGGLYLELEVIALSRDFSRAARFLFGPLIDRLPKEVLSSKLDQTRQAIEAETKERSAHQEQVQGSSSDKNREISR